MAYDNICDEKIKVALVDNNNNNFFSLARYLRERNIDAHLYVIPGHRSAHFLPVNDTFQDVNELDWIHQFPYRTFLRDWLLSMFRKELTIFRHYDLIIACGYSPAFLKREGVQIDIFIPYGSDVFYYPFRVIGSTGIWHYFLKLATRITSFQRRAIKQSSVIVTNPKHKMTKIALDKLHVRALDLGVPMVFPEENGDLDEVWDFLEDHDFIIFNHSRQIWKSNPYKLNDFKKYGGNKRNDKTIKAFSKFITVTKYITPILILFEYGEDVDASKALVDELGIKENVKFMPLMSRKYILQGLCQADLGIDQVRENICGIGGTTYEIMSMGIPALSHTDGATNDETSMFYKAPFVEVLTSNDIYEVFIDYENNIEKYKRIGEESRKWFSKNLGNGLADKYVEVLNKLVNKKKSVP